MTNQATIECLRAIAETLKAPRGERMNMEKFRALHLIYRAVSHLEMIEYDEMLKKQLANENDD